MKSTLSNQQLLPSLSNTAQHLTRIFIEYGGTNGNGQRQVFPRLTRTVAPFTRAAGLCPKFSRVAVIDHRIEGSIPK